MAVGDLDVGLAVPCGDAGPGTKPPRGADPAFQRHHLARVRLRERQPAQAQLARCAGDVGAGHRHAELATPHGFRFAAGA
jgi:hypothetical protein